jgi:pimeloyl-ACP methyl ester carboxylesterase
VFGHSRGGGLAVLFAAAHPEVRALVTWAAIGKLIRWDEATLAKLRDEKKAEVVNMRTGEVLPLYPDVLEDFEAHKDGKLDLHAAAARIRVPWLIVHGEVDEAVALSDGKTLHGLTKGAARLEIIPGGTHTLGARHPWAGYTPELEWGMDLTTEWFTRHLL